MLQSSSPLNYPPGFDHSINKQADALARAIGTEMRAQPDIKRLEYGALIWKNRVAVFRTTLQRGEPTRVKFDKIWNQVGWAGGGKIVSIVHSHPTQQNTGSAKQPFWTAMPNHTSPSSIDFDTILKSSGYHADHDTQGYDTINYRSYLVTESGTFKYYGFNQDHSRFGGTLQATWAVRAIDF